ncbi:MAG: hypothetical protein AAGD22_08775 [Verrucomicrobiota bacterium]
MKIPQKNATAPVLSILAIVSLQHLAFALEIGSEVSVEAIREA